MDKLCRRRSVKKVIELLGRMEVNVLCLELADNEESSRNAILSNINDIKAELRKRKVDIFKGMLADDLSRFYNVKCKKCGWFGSSEFTDGGEEIADTGDYEDILCPACGSVDLEDMPEKLQDVHTERQIKEAEREKSD
jgi:predicted RNA-binding Zn-ribbon protein involved in translation (DUF1610 family)